MIGFLAWAPAMAARVSGTVLVIPFTFFVMNLGPGCGCTPSSLVLRSHPVTLDHSVPTASFASLPVGALRFFSFPIRARLWYIFTRGAIVYGAVGAIGVAFWR